MSVSIQTLPNGLTLIVEEIGHVESAAYNLYIPGGIVLDKPQHLGSSLLLAELTSRGAGAYDSRRLSEEFDGHGIRHGESSGFDRYSYRGSLLAGELEKAFELVGLMVCEPTLPAAEIDNIRSILVQEIHALDDHPSRKAQVEFSERFYPGPWGRPGHGSVEGLNSCTRDVLEREWRESFRPAGSVLSVAGNVETARVIEMARRHFGAWEGNALQRPEFGALRCGGRHHVHADAAQQQIVLGFPSAKFGDKHYYTAKVAAGVLSGGMFGRLFIEVREKRGLCYQVYARHSSSEHCGTIIAFAGTTPERADQTLEVMLAELEKLPGTVTEEELQRAKANLLSQLIISEESTSSRVSSNAGDWWVGGRVRSLDEIKSGVLAVTAADIDEYCEKYPVGAATILTLGSRELWGSAK